MKQYWKRLYSISFRQSVMNLKVSDSLADFPPSKTSIFWKIFNFVNVLTIRLMAVSVQMNIDNNYRTMKISKNRTWKRRLELDLDWHSALSLYKSAEYLPGFLSIFFELIEAEIFIFFQNSISQWCLGRMTEIVRSPRRSIVLSA